MIIILSFHSINVISQKKNVISHIASNFNMENKHKGGIIKQTKNESKKSIQDI